MVRAIAVAVATCLGASTIGTFSVSVRAQTPPAPQSDSAKVRADSAKVRADTTKVRADSAKLKADTARPKPPEDPDRWAAAVDLGFNASTGNTRLLLLTSGFRLRHLETATYRLDWGITFRYGESRGAVVARSVQSNVNFDVSPKKVWSPYAFATLEHDPFRRLQLRSNTGSGITHALYRRKTGELTVSAAALYSHEGFTIPTQPDRDEARWNIQTRGFQRLGNSIRIENSFFYKPVWNQSGDYNLQSSTKLSSKITQRLAMTLTHEYLKDSTPPSGVTQEDQRVQAGLTFEF